MDVRAIAALIWSLSGNIPAGVRKIEATTLALPTKTAGDSGCLLFCSFTLFVYILLHQHSQWPETVHLLTYLQRENAHKTKTLWSANITVESFMWFFCQFIVFNKALIFQYCSRSLKYVQSRVQMDFYCRGQYDTRHLWDALLWRCVQLTLGPFDSYVYKWLQRDHYQE